MRLCHDVTSDEIEAVLGTMEESGTVIGLLHLTVAKMLKLVTAPPADCSILMSDPQLTVAF